MDYFNIAFRLGYAHPDLFLRQLSTSQLTETLAYLWIESGNYEKRPDNDLANLSKTFGNILVKKGK